MHCCRNWNIYVDKATYKKLHGVNNNAELKQLIGEFVRANEESAQDDHYGLIRLKESGFCPFLDAEMLCRIHLELGPSHQGDICRNFPRRVRFFEDHIERDLSFKCPEVVRLVLLKTEPISYLDCSQGEESASEEPILQIRVVYSKQANQLREQALRILTDQGISVEERLVRLGHYINRNATLADASANEAMSLGPELLLNQATEYYPDPMLHLGKIVETADLSLQLTEWDEYRNIAARAFTGLGLTEDGAAVGLTAKNLADYQKGCHDLSRVIQADYPYLMENYLVHEVYSRYFLSGEKLWEDYAKLVLAFALIRFLLAGLNAYDHELEPRKIVGLISLLHRNISGLLKLTIDWMRRGDEMNRPHLENLIRIAAI